MRWLVFSVLVLACAGPATAGVPIHTRHVLVRDGFSRNLNEWPNSSHYRVNVRNVGIIRAGLRTYRIMFYSNENQRPSGHGNYALLVFVERPGRFRYIGGYDVVARPVSIRGKAIHFDSRCDWGCTIVFGDDGPPRRAWIDGENLAFTK